MFKSALIKLTLWYVGIAMLLSLIFSVAIFHFATVELREGLSNQYNAITANGRIDSDGIDLSNQEFQEHAGHLLLQLVYFNVIVLACSTAGSFLLAKRTLKPIMEAHAAQLRFTAHASHELRTPLASIRADTESVLLANKDDAALFKRTLKANLSDVRYMEDLANHLLNVARYRAIPIDKEKIDLMLLVRDAVKEIKRANKVAAKLNISGTSVLVEVDPLAIKLAILSLLDNAIKYGEAKPIYISLTKKGKYAVIEVKDNGQGVDDKEIKHIFEPFYRAVNSKDKQKGHGLGLSLAAEVVDTAGGTIKVNKSPDGGAIFTVYLPCM